MASVPKFINSAVICSAPMTGTAVPTMSHPRTCSSSTGKSPFANFNRMSVALAAVPAIDRINKALRNLPPFGLDILGVKGGKRAFMLLSAVLILSPAAFPPHKLAHLRAHLSTACSAFLSFVACCGSCLNPLPSSSSRQAEKYHCHVKHPATKIPSLTHPSHVFTSLQLFVKHPGVPLILLVPMPRLASKGTWPSALSEQMNF